VDPFVYEFDDEVKLTISRQEVLVYDSKLAIPLDEGNTGFFESIKYNLQIAIGTANAVLVPFSFSTSR